MIAGIADLESSFCALLSHCLLFTSASVASAEIYRAATGKVDVLFGELLIINRFPYESNLQRFSHRFTSVSRQSLGKNSVGFEFFHVTSNKCQA